jgi:hypothetical protein
VLRFMLFPSLRTHTLIQSAPSHNPADTHQ